MTRRHYIYLTETMFRAHVIVLFLATITVSYEAPTQSIEPDQKEPQIMCKDGYCGKISYEELLQTYRGIFFTEEDKDRKLEAISSARESSLLKIGVETSKLNLPGDGDSCCPTDFNYAIHLSLKNINNEDKTIVHMPDASPAVFQLIPEGKCVQGYGNCDGQCYVEPVYLNLLVYDEFSSLWPPVTFDWFEVPGYCSCKNVKPSTYVDQIDSALSIQNRHLG